MEETAAQLGAADDDRAALAAQVARAGLVDAHHDPDRRAAVRQPGLRERGRRAPVEPDALDGHPGAGGGPALQLDVPVREGPGTADARRELAGARAHER